MKNIVNRFGLKNVFLSVAVISMFSSCEDVIDLELRDGVEQLVVDAWLTNENKTQEIKLSLSQPYFDNSAPKAALGATVIVFDEDSVAYRFVDENKDGVYTYNEKQHQQPFNQTGKNYALYVKYNNEEFYSLSKLSRVPTIDSINYEYFEFPVQVNDTIPRTGYLAQFYAKDFIGLADTYWVRFRKNNKLINKPSSISIAYDGGFSPGSQSDGLTFILPLRQSINDGLYQHGDSVTVELYSITNEAYMFLFQVRQESTNAGIFATPPANIPSNMFNLNTKSTKKAIGFFCVSGVSTFSTVIDKAKALPSSR